MSFLKILGKVLNIGEAMAPTVATAINPAAGALISLVLNSVTQAELTGGTGAAKKAQVVKEVTPAATAIIAAVLKSKGTTAALDPAQVNSAVGSIVDGVVALLNSVQTEKTSQAGSSKA
jgi:hypothetical protein